MRASSGSHILSGLMTMSSRPSYSAGFHLRRWSYQSYTNIHRQWVETDDDMSATKNDDFDCASERIILKGPGIARGVFIRGVRIEFGHIFLQSRLFDSKNSVRGFESVTSNPKYTHEIDLQAIVLLKILLIIIVCYYYNYEEGPNYTQISKIRGRE